ncbi:MAG TPA: ATP synthase F1 subunit epsilon [Polyangiaceae bacterium]|nr:ATP synthase F1 subunit epsilon [Polyangiaceae bacterium]
MADTLALEIVTPEGVKLTESVEIFTAPGVNGEFGVMPRHRPMLAALTAGIVTYTRAGLLESVAIGPGFAELADDKAVILTAHFTTKSEVDPVKVRLELKEVDAELDGWKGDPNQPEYAALVARELWAATQLELHGDPPPPRIRTQSELADDPVAHYRTAPAPDGNDSHGAN